MVSVVIPEERFYKTVAGIIGLGNGIYDIIKNSDEVTVFYEHDHGENKGEIHISGDCGEEAVLEAPELPAYSGSGRMVAQRTASNQKIIDCWLEVLASNMRYYATAYMQKNADIRVRHDLLYPERYVFDEPWDWKTASVHIANKRQKCIGNAIND